MSNKTVLITGSSRGIGKGIALEFAKEGYNIIINCSSSSKELDNTLNEIKKYNKNVIAIKADVSDYDSAKIMFQKINENFGDVDILVNNAGISYIGLFNKMLPQEWNNIMSVNLNSVYNCTHLAISSMINKKNGIIINISSIWGNCGASCETVYSASKGAVNSFTKALAKEVAPCNIRVNAIACGVIDTSMNQFLSEDERNNLINEIPLMRFGTIEEIGKTALYLASDSSSYLTGQIITLDGAMT